MSNVKERIRQYIEHLGVSTAEFERTAQIGNGLINKPASQMRSSTLRLISEAYPDLNMDWVRKGRGGMIKAQPTKNAHDVEIEGNDNLVQTDHTIIIKDVKILMEDEINTDDDSIRSLPEAKKRIKKLKELLKEAEKQIIKLEGKVEQQNEILKMYIKK